MGFKINATELTKHIAGYLKQKGLD